MTPWLMILMLFLTPSQPPQIITLGTRTEAGCEQRAAEFIQHLPVKPLGSLVKCVYMPKFLGSI